MQQSPRETLPTPNLLAKGSRCQILCTFRECFRRCSRLRPRSSQLSRTKRSVRHHSLAMLGQEACQTCLHSNLCPTRRWTREIYTWTT